MITNMTETFLVGVLLDVSRSLSLIIYSSQALFIGNPSNYYQTDRVFHENFKERTTWVGGGGYDKDTTMVKDMALDPGVNEIDKCTRRVVGLKCSMARGPAGMHSEIPPSPQKQSRGGRECAQNML